MPTADSGVDPAEPVAQDALTSNPTRRKVIFDQRVAFLGTGAVNTGFAFLVFAALEATLGRAVSYLVILLLAHIVGVVEAFILYRLTAFRVQGNLIVDLARFESVYLIALAINAALLPFFVEFVGLPVIFAQGVIVSITSLVSYLGHKHFSFRRPRETFRI